MSKQLNAEELAQIVTQLLTKPQSVGELETHDSFASFMTGIAEVVCDHCGGAVHHVAAPQEDVWYVGIHGNEALPDVSGGVWSQYDKEGDLFAEGTPQWYEAKYQTAHPDWPRTQWKHDVNQGDTKLGYWEWVMHQVECEAGMPEEPDALEAAQAREEQQ